MAQPILIGKRSFSSKNEALGFYRSILNRYNLGEALNVEDHESVYQLLLLHPRAKEKIRDGITAIKIGRTRYSRCFEFLRKDGTVTSFSYIKRISGSPSKLMKFRKACRQAVEEDLRKAKLGYFQQHSKGGKVRCQESNELLKWEELCVDHRQPHTLSVIIDRFAEVNSINIDEVEYENVRRGPDELKDKELKEKFRKYHLEKANLRLVKKSLNSSRAHQGRILRQKKDLRIDGMSNS